MMVGGCKLVKIEGRMLKKFKVNKLEILVYFLFLIFTTINSIQARQISPAAIPLGGVITMSGKVYIKITSAGKFMETQKWQALSNTTMQGWDDCAALITPTGSNFTQGPILIDARDNKTYEVRKFADGKCWMVENLMYGGDINACAGKKIFNGNGSPNPSNQFGVGTYGDCRDPRVGGVAPCLGGSKACGYYYNWQAAMQQVTAYYGVNYTGSTTNVQGLCPEGWKLPTNDNGGDFEILHLATGLLTNGFWQNGSWKGVLSGYCEDDGRSYLQNNYSYWLSSTPYSQCQFYSAYISSNHFVQSYGDLKNRGFVIRCLKY